MQLISENIFSPANSSSRHLEEIKLLKLEESNQLIDEHFALIVIERRFLTDDVLELTFLQQNSQPLPSWQAGANISLHLAENLHRQYSLVPAGEFTGAWRILVKLEPHSRGGSSFIFETLNIGSTVNSSFPMNHFSFNNGSNSLFIAGGIGITPFLQMIEDANQSGLEWKLDYLGKDKSSMVFAQKLEEDYPDRVNVFSKHHGQVYSVVQRFKDLDSDCDVYVCGPERLLSEIEQIFTHRDVSKLHFERFHPRDLPEKEPDKEFTVYCKKSNVELIVPPEESILMSADFAGIEISGDCMEGTCGTCKTPVLEGEVDHRDSVLSAKERSDGDTMMICISRAKGNRLVIDL